MPGGELLCENEGISPVTLSQTFSYVSLPSVGICDTVPANEILLRPLWWFCSCPLYQQVNSPQLLDCWLLMVTVYPFFAELSLGKEEPPCPGDTHCLPGMPLLHNGHVDKTPLPHTSRWHQLCEPICAPGLPVGSCWNSAHTETTSLLAVSPTIFCSAVPFVACTLSLFLYKNFPPQALLVGELRYDGYISQYMRNYIISIFSIFFVFYSSNLMLWRDSSICYHYENASFFLAFKQKPTECISTYFKYWVWVGHCWAPSHHVWVST